MNMRAKILETAAATAGLHYKFPSVPNVVRLPGGLSIGSKIYIQAVVPAVPDRFAINLQRGTDDDANIQLHFNPRFQVGESTQLVLNTYTGGTWDDEDKVAAPSLRPSCPFLLVLTCFVDCIEMEIDGKILSSFTLRPGQHFNDTTHLRIHQDILLQSIHIPMESFPQTLRVTIPGNTKVGDMYTIKGTVGIAAQRFAVNLQTGPGKKDDIVFHFNPRFDDRVCVVRNDCSEDNWGVEEDEGAMPFKDSQPFELVIAVTSKGFETWVDGKLFIKFAHRQDFKNACCLLIEGDVSVKDVSIDSVPQRMPPQSGDDSITDPNQSSLQLFYPEVPITAFLPPSLGPRKAFIISGTPNIDCERVNIHLRCGSSEPESDIPYHFSARLWKTDPRTVQNSRKNGEWQNEHVLPSDEFVLKAGERFDMQIIWQDSGYNVALNGEEFTTFDHRLDPSNIDQIVVFGDLTVQRLLIV